MKQDFSRPRSLNGKSFFVKAGFITFLILNLGNLQTGHSPAEKVKYFAATGSAVHKFVFSQPDSLSFDTGEMTISKQVGGVVGDAEASSLLADVPIVAYWGGDYRYELGDTMISDATGNYSGTIKSRVNPLAVTDENTIPQGETEFKLSHVFPNPSANGKCSLQFSLLKPAYVKISLYNITGRRLASRSEQLPWGSFQTTFDLSSVANGIYFYQFESDYGVAAGRFLILRNGISRSATKATISSFRPGGNVAASGAMPTKPYSPYARIASEPDYWQDAPDFFSLAVRLPGYHPNEQKVFHSGSISAFNFILQPTDSQFVTLDILVKDPQAGADSLLQDVSVIVSSKNGDEYSRAKTNATGRAVLDLAEPEFTDSLAVRVEYTFPGDEVATSTTLIPTNLRGISYLDANVTEDFTARYSIQAFDRLDNSIQATYELRHNGNALEAITSNSAVEFDVDLNQYSGDGFSVFVEAHGYIAEDFALPAISAGENQTIGLYLTVNNAAMIYRLNGHVQESGSSEPILGLSIEAWHKGLLIQSTLSDSLGNYTLSVIGGGPTNLGIDDSVSIVFNSDFYVNQTMRKAAMDGEETLDATLDFDVFDLHVTGVLKSDGQVLPPGQIMALEIDGLTKTTAATNANGVYNLYYNIDSQAKLDQKVELVGSNLGANGFTYFDEVRETVQTRNRNTQEINPALQFNAYSLIVKGQAIGSDGQGGLDGGKAALFVSQTETSSQNLVGDAFFELSYTVTKLAEAMDQAELRLSHPYFTTKVTMASLSSNATQDFGPITVQFQQSDFRVQGEVLSTLDGNPVEGATVKFPGTPDAFTDNHGWFTTNSFYINSRTDIGLQKTLRISHAGYTDFTRTLTTVYDSMPHIGTVNLVWSFTNFSVTIDGDTEFNLTEPGVGLVAGATVKFIRNSDEMLLDETTTNASGDLTKNLSAYFTSPQTGTARLEWSKAGFNTGTLDSIDITSQRTQVVSDQTIFFTPLAQSVNGRITSVTSGQPIASATISWQAGSSVSSDANGDYSYSDMMTLSTDSGTQRTVTVSASGYRDSSFTYIRSTTPVTQNLALQDGPANPQLDVSLWVRDLLGNTSNVVVTLQADGFPAEFLATSNGLLTTKLNYNGNSFSTIRIWIGDGMVAIPELGKASARTGAGVVDTLKVTAGDLATEQTAYFIPNSFTNPNGGTVSFNQFCDFIGAATGFARNFNDNGEVQVPKFDPANKPVDAADYNDSKSTVDALILDLQSTMADGKYFGMQNVTSRLINDDTDPQFKAANTLQLFTDNSATSNSFSVINRTGTHVTQGEAKYIPAATAAEKREQMLGLLLDLVDWDGSGITNWMVGSDGHIHQLGHQIKNAIYMFRGKQMK